MAVHATISIQSIQYTTPVKSYTPFDVTTNQIALPIPLINQVPGIILIRILQRIRTPFFDPRGIPLHQELYVEGIDVGGVEAGTGT